MVLVGTFLALAVWLSWTVQPAQAQDVGLTLSGPSSIVILEDGSETGLDHDSSNRPYSVSGGGTDVTWSLTGNDEHLFHLTDLGNNRKRQEFISLDQLNYEDPLDADANSIYDVTIQATDGVATATSAESNPKPPRQVKIVDVTPHNPDYNGDRGYNAMVSWKGPTRSGWGGLKVWKWKEPKVDPTADKAAGFQIRIRGTDFHTTAPHNVRGMGFGHYVADDGQDGIDLDAGTVDVVHFEVRTWIRVDGVDRYSEWVDAQYPKPEIEIIDIFAWDRQSYYFGDRKFKLHVGWWVKAGNYATRYKVVFTPVGGERQEHIVNDPTQFLKLDEAPRNVSFTVKVRGYNNKGWGPPVSWTLTPKALTTAQQEYDGNSDGWLNDTELSKAIDDYEAGEFTWEAYGKLMDILSLDYTTVRN